MRIRAAHDGELAALREIEQAAGEAFREIGMPEIADDEPLPVAVLAGYAAAGRAWVAVDDADRPAGYLIADELDGHLHIEQVSVHPAHARRGIGRRLIDHLPGTLTLTTFAAVPWNAPYYRRCGFVVLADGELTPALRAVREREAAHGLDRWPRVCMRR
ncbi:putative GCN5-related N-acetyltransferase [Actinoplanes missouriensis 431]|uniref:Putative GCN5-related N-acetyltransferase n=1 Tax=Actinoplanes missouriensis (strain ATCC 14538 / DSM 43046 / CBS 188.64 / JCM 3121 / NBRC 102363 / NCIMB 12654 / NRRL B-3342 / UNCC 431) TaxID=512565 RepID=I0H8H4_ACTM4|nr:GNAT family N-acetyltransferase [Actinoplanes missouriensis]BAL89311.1 putative GCN5-related N-acetyltransferase [Actinoplanes missouriensis 431]